MEEGVFLTQRTTADTKVAVSGEVVAGSRVGEGMPEWRRGYFPCDEPQWTPTWQSVGRWLEGL